MRTINPAQVQAVLALPGLERYDHFVKVVVDWEEVWGLHKDGWALAETDDGQPVFPLWPAEQYARLCATEGWQDFEPSSFSLDELMEELLPKLREDGVLPGVFFTPGDKGVTPTVEQLLEDLSSHLKESYL